MASGGAEERQHLFQASHETEVRVEDVGITLRPCWHLNPFDRYNLGVRIINGILAQDTLIRPLRFANIVNRYGPAWAFFSSLMFLCQLIALVTIISVGVFHPTPTWALVSGIITLVFTIFDG